MFKCPACGETEALAVIVNVWAKLVQTDEGVETDADHADLPDHGHNWTGNNTMMCLKCRRGGKAYEYEILE